jgi:hypothetical protein
VIDLVGAVTGVIAEPVRRHDRAYKVRRGLLRKQLEAGFHGGELSAAGTGQAGVGGRVEADTSRVYSTVNWSSSSRFCVAGGPGLRVLAVSVAVPMIVNEPASGDLNVGCRRPEPVTTSSRPNAADAKRDGERDHRWVKPGKPRDARPKPAHTRPRQPGSAAR